MVGVFSAGPFSLGMEQMVVVVEKIQNLAAAAAENNGPAPPPRNDWLVASGRGPASSFSSRY